MTRIFLGGIVCTQGNGAQHNTTRGDKKMTTTTTATAQKYYVIETNHVDTENGDKVEIRTSPARTNFSHEERINGFCGATNNRAVYAHGEYSTLESARAAIASLFDVTDDDEAESDDEEIVETYFLKGDDDDEEAEGDDA